MPADHMCTLQQRSRGAFCDQEVIISNSEEIQDDPALKTPETQKSQHSHVPRLEVREA
jgi:hypothetical protein